MIVTAIIIARGGSERLHNKNLLDFHGRSLVAHKVWQLGKARTVDRIFVGTNSPEIAEAAKAEGAEVRMRREEFCDEKSRTWNDVIVDMAGMVPGDIVLWAHCTNPCIQPQTYDRALAKYYANDSKDSVIGVTKLQSHLWFNNQPFNFNPWNGRHPLAAELDPVFFQNGGLFVYDRQSMLSNRYVYGKRPILMEIDPDESTDIDTEQDYQRAVSLYNSVVSRHGT